MIRMRDNRNRILDGRCCCAADETRRSMTCWKRCAQELLRREEEAREHLKLNTAAALPGHRRREQRYKARKFLTLPTQQLRTTQQVRVRRNSASDGTAGHTKAPVAICAYSLYNGVP